jgi:hypothetical protein
LPVNSRTVPHHAHNHIHVVSALQFNVDQTAVRTLAQQIHPQVADYRQPDIMPPVDGHGRPRK